MNKKWTLRFRTRDRKNFIEIKEGLKTVETRAATSRYRKIKKGDILIFVCGKERFEKEIKNVKIFKSVDLMTESIDFKNIMPSVNSVLEMKKIYGTYPSYKEKIKKFGLIAVEL